MDKILVRDFYDDIKLVETITYEGKNKLAWPISKTDKVKSIVIHHTVSDYEDSYDWIRQIYKFHALSRQWWDIGYNFLIWKNWEIFEWRAGGDYVVSAHDMRNNRSTLWIAILWDYSEKEISKEQRDSLKNLIKLLVKKYDINLNDKANYHVECFWDECVKPIESYKLDSIIGHRDAGHTACPWDALYEQINLIKTELRSELGFIKINKVKFYKKLDKIDEYSILNILYKFEKYLDTHFFNKIALDYNKNIEIINDLKFLIINYFKEKLSFKPSSLGDNIVSKIKKIKIKLSYPNNDYIKISSWTEDYEIKRNWNYLEVNWNKQKVINIKSNKDSYLEILSWERIPSWDINKKYNDNKFRWDLIVYLKDRELVVVNKIDLEYYLKWLWEVSNNDHIEKIKTIIIAARSYAKWYIEIDRKFPWEWYDWSDHPNEFQKYLWFSLESRSPNINKIVDDTNWEVITYDWKLIKPWYFSQSNWKTLSFINYCLKNNLEDKCRELEKKYPYLQSVDDYVGKWKQRLWHWVWISWIWATFLAKKWWLSDMIIKYYFKGVSVNRM